MTIADTTEVIGKRYILNQELGTGGMGKVYRALDRPTGFYPLSALFGRPRVSGKGLRSRTKCPVCTTAVALGRRGWAGRVGTIMPSLRSIYHNLYATGVKAAPLPTRSLGGRDPVCLVVRRDDGGQV